MEEFDDLKYVISKMSLEKPSLSFVNNVMRTVETKEIKWSFNYILKYVAPFIGFAIIFTALVVLNLLGYHLPSVLDLLPTNIVTYITYTKIFSIGLSLILSTLFGIKQLKNKTIKL